MESLLAHIARKERDRLRVTIIDVDEKTEVATRFLVDSVPTLVLVKEKRVVARLEGRASAPRIERMIEPHLDEELAVAWGAGSRSITASVNSAARAPSTTRWS